MERILKRNQVEIEVSMNDQIKKFGIDSLYGFNIIILIGIGRRLGIFNYLYGKGKSIPTHDNTKSIIFTPDELSEKLNLDNNYLDAWIHLAIECELLEIENVNEKWLKTSPYIYEILINRNHPSYIGGTLGAFYNITLIQEKMLKNFKTGEAMDLLDFPLEMAKDLQERGRRFGILIKRLFHKHFKDFCEKLDEKSKILEVGCGFGYNLETWAKKFQKAEFVAIGIDPEGINHAKKVVEENEWDERIKILEISVKKFAHTYNEKFNLIILNQVLHEMDPDENFRIKLFKDLYSLLKDDGILLVGESMIPDTFAPKQKFKLFDITHKFFEAGSASFYNEETFKKFVESTSFKKAEFIKEGGTYFWLVKK